MTRGGKHSATRAAALTILSLVALSWAGCAGSSGKGMAPARLQAIDHNQRGIEAEARGNGDAALAEFSQAFRLHGSIENRDGMVIALINIARTLRLRGDLASARQAIERASSLLQEHSALAPELSFERAKILLAAGELTAAHEWAVRAAAETGEGRGRRLNLVALTLFRQGLPAQAREQAESALGLNRASGLAGEEANSLRLLGEIELAQGRGDRATDFFNGALSLDKELGSGRKIAADLRGLGRAALTTGDLTGAIGFCRRALEVSLNNGDSASAADDMARLAELYQRQGEPELAEQIAAERQELLKAGKSDR